MAGRVCAVAPLDAAADHQAAVGVFGQHYAAAVSSQHHPAIYSTRKPHHVVWRETSTWDLPQHPGRAVHLHAELLPWLWQSALFPGERPVQRRVCRDGIDLRHLGPTQQLAFGGIAVVWPTDPHRSALGLLGPPLRASVAAARPDSCHPWAHRAEQPRGAGLDWNFAEGFEEFGRLLFCYCLCVLRPELFRGFPLFQCIREFNARQRV
mmetsp:Transcript_8943/g.15238  ORF Transcript_8943/g.15238 Transcript_8943/m.15238 type:complete len:208 (-) Transcript_8943:367-990(-)